MFSVFDALRSLDIGRACNGRAASESLEFGILRVRRGFSARTLICESSVVSTKTYSPNGDESHGRIQTKSPTINKMEMSCVWLGDLGLGTTQVLPSKHSWVELSHIISRPPITRSLNKKTTLQVIQSELFIPDRCRSLILWRSLFRPPFQKVSSSQNCHQSQVVSTDVFLRREFTGNSTHLWRFSITSVDFLPS